MMTWRMAIPVIDGTDPTEVVNVSCELDARDQGLTLTGIRLVSKNPLGDTSQSPAVKMHLYEATAE